MKSPAASPSAFRKRAQSTARLRSATKDKRHHGNASRRQDCDYHRGSRGQGAATAKLFSSEGAQIMLADVNVPDPSLMDFLDGSAHFMRLDVSDEAGWRDVVAATQKTLGESTF